MGRNFVLREAISANKIAFGLKPETKNNFNGMKYPLRTTPPSTSTKTSPAQQGKRAFRAKTSPSRFVTVLIFYNQISKGGKLLTIL